MDRVQADYAIPPDDPLDVLEHVRGEVEDVSPGRRLGIEGSILLKSILKQRIQSRPEDKIGHRPVRVIVFWLVESISRIRFMSLCASYELWLENSQPASP